MSSIDHLDPDRAAEAGIDPEYMLEITKANNRAKIAAKILDVLTVVVIFAAITILIRGWP